MRWTVAVGVDRHKDVRVAVVLDALGVRLDGGEVAATAAGCRSLLCWALEFGVSAFAVEGTGGYGAGLVRFLEAAGVNVYGCERRRRRGRRRGKSGLIDAVLAGRRLLSGERLSLPRGGGRREDLRLLLLERRGAMQARNAALNQLSAVFGCRTRSGARAAGSAVRGTTGARGGSASARRRGHQRCSAAARPARRATLARGGRGRACSRRARRRSRAGAARGVRRRPGQARARPPLLPTPARDPRTPLDNIEASETAWLCGSYVRGVRLMPVPCRPRWDLDNRTAAAWCSTDGSGRSTRHASASGYSEVGSLVPSTPDRKGRARKASQVGEATPRGRSPAPATSSSRPDHKAMIHVGESEAAGAPPAQLMQAGSLRPSRTAKEKPRPLSSEQRRPVPFHLDRRGAASPHQPSNARRRDSAAPA
jgi:Transposase